MFVDEKEVMKNIAFCASFQPSLPEFDRTTSRIQPPNPKSKFNARTMACLVKNKMKYKTKTCITISKTTTIQQICDIVQIRVNSQLCLFCKNGVKVYACQ